jgi:hypothetical protein
MSCGEYQFYSPRPIRDRGNGPPGSTEVVVPKTGPSRLRGVASRAVEVLFGKREKLQEHCARTRDLDVELSCLESLGSLPDRGLNLYDLLVIEF